MIQLNSSTNEEELIIMSMYKVFEELNCKHLIWLKRMTFSSILKSLLYMLVQQIVWPVCVIRNSFYETYFATDPIADICIYNSQVLFI